MIRRGRTYFPLSRNRYVHADGSTESFHGKLWVVRDGLPRNLEAGNRVSVSGVFHPDRPSRNPGDFDTRAWRERNGFIGTLFSSAGNRISVGTKRPSPVYALRNEISRRADDFWGKNAPLLKALLLGIRRDVDPGLVEDLRITGLSHLLALSGLHVGFIVVILIALGAIFRLSPAYRAGLALIGIVLFLLLVPPRACTLRAFIMIAVFLDGPIIKRWSPPLNALALAALIILCLRPGDLFDAGFQLSFAAAGGIVLYLPARESLKSWLGAVKNRTMRLTWRYLIEPLVISCAASFLVIPLTTYHFGLAAFGGPIFNIVAIPLLWFIFAGAWLTMGFSVVWNGLATLAADGITGIVLLFNWVARFFASFAPVWHGRLAPLVIAIIIAVFIWLALSQLSYRFRLALGSLLIILALVIQALIPQPLGFQAWFLDVGNGDAQVWRFPGGKTVLIDGGPMPWIGNRNIVADVLDHFNVKEINLLVATHPEADHIGGLPDVIEGFPVELALCNGYTFGSQTYARLCSVSTAHDLDWQTAAYDTRIKGLPEEFCLTVLGPPQDYKAWSVNDASVVLMLEALTNDGQRLRLLTTGDIEKKGEMTLLEQSDISAQLLKLPHHGSKTSSSPEFITAVNPEIAVVTRSGTWERSRFKFSNEVILRLQNEGRIVYNTGDEGALLFEPSMVDGEAKWRRVDWRNPPFFRWLAGL